MQVLTESVGKRFITQGRLKIVTGYRILTSTDVQMMNGC